MPTESNSELRLARELPPVRPPPSPEGRKEEPSSAFSLPHEQLRALSLICFTPELE